MTKTYKSVTNMFTVCNQWQAKLIVLGSGEHNHRYLFDLWNIYVVFVRACTFDYYMQQTIEKNYDLEMLTIKTQ